MKQVRAWIVLIGSAPEVAQAVGETLEAAGYSYTWFRSTATFLATPLEEHPRCIVVDFDCGQMHGSLAMLEDLITASWRWPVVVANLRGELPAPIRILRLQNFVFLDEPYSHAALMRAIRRTSRLRPYRAANGVAPSLRLMRSLTRLTPREMAIAGEMLHGRSSKQIARRCHISEKTVELHRSRVLQKMRVNSTSELLWLYLKTGAH